MNVILQAQRAYSAARGTTRTPRRIEYEALARMSSQLRGAADSGPAGFGALAEAVHDNRKLWSVFALHAASSGNPLPEGLKANILYLAEFTRQHSSKVLARRAGVDPLLDVNAAVMRGLRDGGHERNTG